MTTDTLDGPLDISVERLTCVLTSRDAKKLRLEFETVDGQTAALSIPTSSVRQLITTLSLAEKLPALTAQLTRDSTRVVFPLSGWRMEQWSGFENPILTLTTSDGFEVSYAADRSEIEQLGEAIQEFCALVEQPHQRLDS